MAQKDKSYQGIPSGLIVEMVENRPAFNLLSYDELAGNLNYYYNRLRNFLTTASVVQYSELADMRQKASKLAINEPGYNRNIAQLRLAADLLRLGRRLESYNLLNNLETELLDWEDPSQSLCYLLWIALLKAASNDKQHAYYLAFKITTQNTNSQLDRLVSIFFKSLYSPASRLFND